MKLVLTFILLAGVAAPVQAGDCDIPGKTLHWVAAYCMHLAGTDDFLEEGVQKCFDAKKGYDIKDTCENRKRYKREMCRLMAKNGLSDEDPEECLLNPSVVPAIVRNDGI